MAKGKLYIVATPIGNLEDMTLRAIRTLKSAGLIAAEDTRHSLKLLKRYGITTPMTSYHDFTSEGKRNQLIRKMLRGTDLALISDAGTPGISDPGYRLIREALEQGIEVCTAPGPSVLAAALSVSGLPTDSFFFKGYLPNRAGPRRACLHELKSRTETLILFETPHRILSALREMLDILGDRRIAVVRELTKLHEEIFRGGIEQALDHFRTQERIRGEFTLVVEGFASGEDPKIEIDLASEIRKVIREQKVSRKEAVRIVAEACGLPKKEVYRESLKG
ncbi:MAG: 16S rRNA (cytidine(1402)-2'-O)-methyltransferase [Nitrospirae bacterium CG_4_9_14_3_um_filter_53_35]|nr:MAG: 16S rRNA (cytidine(1402)-2'-O)-methyltransferase [Nitrospirae bacterium CG2_30_53_67]PIS38518.1 MAG: 16S rRNA (cytidine(1402)-2'-O)-methyltransferase [Nitrospirae bacterium CG08_land_8_20_14_0_20_52_24]PIV82286.1 MAG: 16S rRNA (cytidine(1402)-2'-O)-methyltransferase [Nitrospirae bacterium CG17_big_fil_post_rev_8_21_14_2_50_50_9]PIW86282.1 MAG: 16S rRNA (cytidine(1402)-2'-O)-methyltransferase [Nitrospirae bacterium CG_4_8_14_3_um_filter_50_41]PIX86378.1 MAG: 16S rRNA (cytidine(1402)-2'-O